MTDTVIKGSGNSRTLVTVPNALALYPTHEELMTKWATEGIPIDLGPLNAAGCDVIGTALNQANLLSASVGSWLGASTPSQAFQALYNGLNNVGTTANSRLRAQVGSYTGASPYDQSLNGSYAVAASKTLSFSFVPKIVIVDAKNPSPGNSQFAGNAAALPLIMLGNSDMATGIERGGSGTRNRSVMLTWSGYSVTWQFRTDFTAIAHDEEGKPYVYIAIG